MASCENCKQKVPAEQVMVASRGDEKILIGPCCFGAKVQPMEPQVEYHFEFSSKNGLVANMSYAGLRIEYRKSADEVQEMAQSFTQENHVTH